MISPLLLDTCAAIWAGEPGADSGPTRAILRDAKAARTDIYLSPITAWELGTLVARGRLTLALPTSAWFARFLSAGNLALAEMPPAVLIASTELPGDIHGDPADRIIIATAREYGLRVVTRDRRILEYAQKGHVQALAC